MELGDSEPDFVVVRNEDIDIGSLRQYRQEISANGIIGFQLTEEQFSSVMNKCNELRRARKREDFDGESWGQNTAFSLSDPVALAVFTAVVAHWHSNTHVSGIKAGDVRILTIESKSQTH